MVNYACNTTKSKDFQQYFDAATYIESQSLQILANKKYYNTTIELNNTKEQKENIVLDTVALTEMVNLFKTANINKKINQDQYKLDTFWILDPVTNENIEVVNYTTTNKKLNVQWFQQYSNGAMKALISQHNFLYSYEKEIYYNTQKQFSIISWQKTLGQDTMRMFSLVEFLE